VRATGDNNKKGLTMNSLVTRVVTAATVGLLAVSFAAPSFAQTRVKRVPAEQSEYYVEQNAQLAHPGAPASVYSQPNACFTDEGYGRYASCDQAGN
jgi:hypothetical protein